MALVYWIICEISKLICLELNSGWPCYIHQSNTADIKKYKTNVLLDIARITKGFLTKSEINLVNLFELKKVNVTNI